MNWFGTRPILQGGRWEVKYFELVTVTTEWGRDIWDINKRHVYVYQEGGRSGRLSTQERGGKEKGGWRSNCYC